MHATVQLLHRARSEDRRMGGAGKKEEQEVQEDWKEQDEEEWDKQDGQEETTEGNGPLADQGKKLGRGRLIFREVGTKGFIERLALWSDVVNLKDKRKVIFQKSRLKANKKGGATSAKHRYHS